MRRLARDAATGAAALRSRIRKETRLRTHRARWLLVLALLAATALPARAWAADAKKVLVVISVKVNGDRQAYLDQVKALQGITKRLGSPAARVWRATLAGENTDTIYIATEYESMAAMAEAQGKLNADPEATKLVRDLDRSGIRTVIDRSLMVDDTPQ
jgi:hypothetical protein